MGDFNYSSASTDRLDPKTADITEQLSPDEAPTIVRRKSSVRFLDEVTTIDDDAGDLAGEVMYSRRESTNHNCSFVVSDGKNMVDEQTTSEGESAPFYRWKTDRKKREARMEQNINWLRDEITKLKQQDQSLMRQFLQLRSVIYQLKGTVSSGQRPVVKLPKIAASMDSIARYQSNADGLQSLGENNELAFEVDEDDLSELDDQIGLMEDQYLPEFRGRTVSLLNPGNVARTSVVSGGYGYLKSRTMSFSVGTSEREQDRAIIE